VFGPGDPAVATIGYKVYPQAHVVHLTNAVAVPADAREVTDVVEHTAQFAIPINAVAPPDGVAAVVPVHEKQVVPAKTYPEAHVKAEIAPADEMLHVAIPAAYKVTPVVAPAVGIVHETHDVVAEL